MNVLETEVIKAGIHKNRYFRKVLENTIKSLKYFEYENIMNQQEINEYMVSIENISRMINTCKSLVNDNIKMLSCLQDINNALFCLMKKCGTYQLSDLLYICFGQEYEMELSDHVNDEKFKMLLQYVRPYKFTNCGKISKMYSGVHDADIVMSGKNLDCFDVCDTTIFECNTFGIRILFQNRKKSTIVVHGIIENVVIGCSDIPYVENYLSQIKESEIKKECTDSHIWNAFIENICLKSVAIYSTFELVQKYKSFWSMLQVIKATNISQLVSDFLSKSMMEQRTILCILLTDYNIESQYKAYLLYDLLSNDSNEVIDTKNQIRILNSFTWNMKKRFRFAMKQTIDYTVKIVNKDNVQIPYEQQICLLNAPLHVKEKATNKLKEIKSKSEDSGGKARQYLDGLLKIPFGIYRCEPVLLYMQDIKQKYNEITNHSLDELKSVSGFEIVEKVKKLMNIDVIQSNETIHILVDKITHSNRQNIINDIHTLNFFLKQSNIQMRVNHSGHSKTKIKDNLYHVLSKLDQKILDKVYELFHLEKSLKYIQIKQYSQIIEKWNNVSKCLRNNRIILDNAVYGHEEAKKSIERIIGQWMNGDLMGYCFGFEGPPGVGKTSLAKKGLANTLVDVNGESRPFRFIAIGGSSNGSTLEGHNYTYVGSTWGRIVDILMECKCMNPIIFIDELDKVSQTEQGKEIIGILTHMIDPSQNDEFQDKYFNGINIDLSKVLFVFSYNDANLIDRILLDRIHRIKFNHLNEEEKMVIAEKYILPEIFKKMGLNRDIVQIHNDVLRYLINHYTNESGVRRLKELLFEIISEINIELFHETITIPVHINIELVKEKYLKKLHEIRHTKILNDPKVGLISGLWANALGLGGILPIQVKFFPTTTFLDFKLTGMQGDVMKESMMVARTVACNLTKNTVLNTMKNKMKKETNVGLHIHCPEGATPKDGPSAGGAITVCIYSLLNNKKIKHNVAMTGEITLEGNITAIGGLEYKVLGGLKAGVKLFLFPEENVDDFNKIVEKYPNIKNEAEFISVSTIHQVINLVFA